MPLPRTRLARPIRLATKLAGRLAERALGVPLALLTFVIPRSPRLWVFGSTYGTRFADNPKHLFLHCHASASPAARAVWISGSRSVVRAVRRLGLPAFHRHSPQGLWYALRAGVYFVDCRVMDVSAVGARGATIVNLWHGIPLKRIERDIEQPHHAIHRARHGSFAWRAANRLLRPQLTERYDYVLATGPAAAERLGSAFGVEPGQLLSLGYPRTDPLLDPGMCERWLTEEERTVADALDADRRAGRRVMLYMPTFRDWRNDGSRRIPIDWAAMDAALARDGGVLYCKLHPSDQTSLPPLEGCERIRVLPSTIDVYPLLSRTDALISDYSSIFFDYLLLDRPILFYAYDLEEYQRLSRSLYDRYDDVTPGERVETPSELEAAVGRLLRSYDAESSRWQGARAAVRARFFAHVDAGAGTRVCAAVQRLAA